MARARAPIADDKRLQNTLKRLGVNTIPGIEEVNLFKDNGSVVHFSNPKVQASIAANTYVISGHAETKRLQEIIGPFRFLGNSRRFSDGNKNLPNI